MSLIAAILWVVFVCFGWEALGLPELDFWTSVLLSALGVALIGTVEK